MVGAGHAGCEAALSSARMGCETLLLTMNLDTVGLMPCNPSMGGPAKGHLVREIDALNGEVARNTDKTFIQIRMLNTGKGPAVQVPRAQCDKRLYMLSMKHTLERQPNLSLKQGMVKELIPLQAALDDEPPAETSTLFQIKTATGWVYEGKSVVLTTGTSLEGRIVVGGTSATGGRTGEPAALGLSGCLQSLGHTMGRLKTGTPPRVDARSIDFSRIPLHPGHPTPLYFSFAPPPPEECYFRPMNPIYPPGPPTPWRPQLPCYLVHTNERTHQLILDNLHRAPMFDGTIQARGPRYCPSIEDKIFRFQDKPSHGLFLEPEGWETNEVYVQGANTSLPEDVQIEMLHTIPALERCEVMRVGYAIEYDFVPPNQTTASLESKLAPGLFFAGQINGTTGYEEAAGQGIIAGINAARRATGKSPLLLRRNQAYIGVMIDDLVTRDLEEPYRQMTSRAEFRLLLRQDNADLRLTPIAYDMGLVGRERYLEVENKRDRIAEELKRVAKSYVNPNQRLAEALEKLGLGPLTSNVSAVEFLRRQDVGYRTLLALGLGDPSLSPEVQEEVEIEAKYAGYIAKQQTEVERLRKLEGRAIPEDFDYDAVPTLRTEAREKLKRFLPATVGQASRIMGVNPSDMAILLVWLERQKVRS